VVDAALRVKLLGQLAELEDVTASLSLAVEAHPEGLAEGLLAELLAGIGAALLRLRALRSTLPSEGDPEPSPGGAGLPGECA
jgi:hypothetical protein